MLSNQHKYFFKIQPFFYSFATHPTHLMVAIKNKAAFLFMLFASSSFIHFTFISLQGFVHFTLLHSLHYLTLHFSFTHFSPLQQHTATAFLHFISQAILCFVSWYLSLLGCMVCSRLTLNYYILLGF